MIKKMTNSFTYVGMFMQGYLYSYTMILNNPKFPLLKANKFPLQRQS